MKTVIVLGTRPEIIKFGPIINKTNKKNTLIIFTGQHYNYNMSKQFFNEMNIREPDYSLHLTKLRNTSTDRATQIGEIVIKLAKIITKIQPDNLMVQGDTNTVLAAALTGIKCGIPISHVESGLRSYDWRMPEEHNRIAVDHISDFLFAPTKYSEKILKSEKVHGKIIVTGNTSIDAVQENMKKIKTKVSSKFINSIPEDFLLVTLHRGENVDNPQIFTSILKGILRVTEKPLVFPIHPRTLNRLNEFNLMNKIKNSKNITLFPAVGYLQMLYLMKKCSLILSDSGGIQEESTAPSIRKKVLVLRDTTDRPEAIKAGYSELIGTKSGEIYSAIKKNLQDPKIKIKSNPYGNGHASEKILKFLSKNV